MNYNCPTREEQDQYSRDYRDKVKQSLDELNAIANKKFGTSTRKNFYIEELDDQWNLFYMGIALTGTTGAESIFFEGVTKETSFVDSIIILANNYLEFWKIKN